MSLAAQRGRIAVLTAAALFALFVGQPLHGSVASHAAATAATASFASDPGGTATDAPHADSCPLCRAANQARFAVSAAPYVFVAALVFQTLAVTTAPDSAPYALDPCVSGPRAPPSAPPV